MQGARLQIKDKIQLSSQGNEPRRDEKYTILFLHHSELQMPSDANHQTEDHKNEESTLQHRILASSPTSAEEPEQRTQNNPVFYIGFGLKDTNCVIICKKKSKMTCKCPRGQKLCFKLRSPV